MAGDVKTVISAGMSPKVYTYAAIDRSPEMRNGDREGRRSNGSQMRYFASAVASGLYPLPMC